MKSFFTNIWKYIALFFGGVIAALVYAMKQMKPETTVINAGTYIQEPRQETRIGKVKNRGEGVQSVEQSPDMTASEPNRREQRKARRRERRSKSQTDDEACWRRLIEELSFRF